MGFLDVGFPNTDDIVDLVGSVSGPDPNEGLALGGAIVAGGTGIASGGTLAGILLPTLASIYLEGTTERVLQNTHQSLSELSENLDGEDMKSAGLAKACDGVCRLIDPALPDHDLVGLAHNEPEQLDAIFNKVLAADDAERNQLEQIERSLSAVLLGQDPPKDVDLGFDPSDYESLVEELQDIFETEDDQEAIHLFILYEEFLADLTTEFTSNLYENDQADLNDAVIEDLSEIVEKLNEHSTKLIEEWLRIELADEEGFTQLDVDYFHDRTAFEQRDPLTSWIFGDITHGQIHKSRQSEGIRYQFDLFAPESEVPFRREVRNHIASSEKPTAVIAGPECGKSTLCRQVAYDWVNNNRGIVFYRSTDSKHPFTASTKLITAIERAQDRGSGHPLIVVEDATRDDATEIFDVISEIQDERPDLDVSFLLDSRKKDWERFVDDDQNPHKQLVNPYRSESGIDCIELPQLSVRTCKDAISVLGDILEFTNNPLIGRSSGSEWINDLDSQQLYKDVTNELLGEDEQAYEITTLITGLFDHVHLIDISPLKSGGAETHQQLMPEGGSETMASTELRYRLSVLLNLLNASENSVHPALLFAVGLPNIEEMSKQEVTSVFSEIEHLLLDPENGMQDQMYRLPSSASIRTDSIPCRPTAWSESFIENGYKSDKHRPIMRRSIIDAFDGIFELYEDKKNQQLIQQWFQTESQFEPSRYFIDESETTKLESLLKSIFEWAGSDNNLHPKPERRQLFKPTTDGLFAHEPLVDRLPDDCSPLLKYDLQSYIIPTNRDDAQSEFEKVEKLAKKDRELTYNQEQELLGYINYIRGYGLRGHIKTYPNHHINDAIEAYRLALEHYKNADEYEAVGNTLLSLSEISPDDDTIVTLEKAKKQFEKAGATGKINRVIYELERKLDYEGNDFERVKELRLQTIQIDKKRGEYESAALSLMRLGEKLIHVNNPEDIDITTAATYFEASLAYTYASKTKYEISEKLLEIAKKFNIRLNRYDLNSSKNLSQCPSLSRRYATQAIRLFENSQPPYTSENSNHLSDSTVPNIKIAEAYITIGLTYMNSIQPDSKKAMKYFQRSVNSLPEDAGQLDDFCGVLTHIGSIILDNDEFDDDSGLEYYDRAIETCIQKNKIEKAAKMSAKVYSSYRDNSYVEYLQQAFEILADGPDSTSVASTIFWECILFGIEDDLPAETIYSWFDESIRKLRVAEDTASKIADTLSVKNKQMRILSHYGEFNIENEGYSSETAERQLKRVIDIYNECNELSNPGKVANYVENPARAASELGEMYGKRGNISQSVYWYFASLCFYDSTRIIEIGQIPIEIYQDIANVYRKEPEENAVKIRRCYDIAISTGERYGSNYYHVLAELWQERAEFERSVSENNNQMMVSAYENAIKYYKLEGGKRNLVRVASLYEELGGHYATVDDDIENAANCSRQAMAAYADATRFRSLTDPWYEFVGHMKVSDAPQYQTAHSLLLDGLGHCREEKDHKQRITFHLWLGLTCKMSDEFTVDEAVSYLEKGLEICDESDQPHSYLRARLFEELSETRADSGAPEQALEFCENSLEICIDHLSLDTESQTQTDDFLNIVFESLEIMSELDPENVNSTDYDSYYDELRQLLEDNDEVLKKEENCSLDRFEKLSTTISSMNH